MTKVRRQLFEQKVRDFLDAVEHISTHPLLLWAPGVGEKAKALVKEVAKLRRRTMAPRSEKRGTS